MPSIVDLQRFYNHDLYTVNLHGNKIKVTVTANASVVKKWICTTLFLFRRCYIQQDRLVVGLGVQWTPGPCGSDPPADTLQLCIGHRCLIFQLAHASNVPRSLRSFLLNPDHTFVGFWNYFDRQKLETSDQRFQMYRNPLDLRHYAEPEYENDDGNLAGASVDEIVEKCLGFEIEQSREIGRNDWDDEDLSDEQVVYASVDAYCAFCIGKNVRAWKYT